MIKHFLSLSSLSVSEINSLLDRSHFFSQNIQQPDQINHLLKDKVIANAFYEPSTRTRCSFEMAAKRLGAEVINFVPENSSVKKGETVYDTLRTLESVGVDAIVLRHADDQVFDELKDKFTLPLINAGAGKHEHPSQGLLDLLTLKDEFQRLEGLKIAICGDIKHSRVAGSMLVAAEKFGMQIHLCGPKELLPAAPNSFVRETPFDEALQDVDAVMMLRIQLERHEALDINARTYHENFGLNLRRLQMMKERSIIMHPGPFNRGVEISDEVVEHPKSRIFQQMKNGVFARMAILEKMMRG